MLKEFKEQLWVSVLFTLALTLLLGFVYPGVTTLLGKALFGRQAEGSFLEVKGKKAGSELIGQPFDDVKYFWGRPSATGPFAYNAGASSGSNLGPLNPALADAVKGRVEALRKADPGNRAPVPMDLVTASGSGLDPHISPAAADYQASRVAKARNLDLQKVQGLIARFTEGRTWGFLGDPRVNVLKLNLALDGLLP